MKQADAIDRTPSAIKMKAPETKIKAAIRFCPPVQSGMYPQGEAIGFSAAPVTSDQTYNSGKISRYS
jgi:hypothetical protein